MGRVLSFKACIIALACCVLKSLKPASILPLPAIARRIPPLSLNSCIHSRAVPLPKGEQDFAPNASLIVMEPTAPATAFGQVLRLASDPRLHQAFRWLHLQEQQVFRWQVDLVQVPAPPFGESARASWLADRFRELELADITIDSAGNVIGKLPGAQLCEGSILLSAHIDTVFPADTAIEPAVNGTRLIAPGACDNGAGIAGMLALIAALRAAAFRPPCDLHFAGNVGEEGDGDLRGMRHLYQNAPWRERIAAHIVLDGAGDNIAITHALGSQRYRATVTGPGGHSWTDSGAPNPIVVLSKAIARLSELDLPGLPRTTFSVGLIEGGTAINAIPESAQASFDLRSTDPEQLIRLEVELHRALEDAVIEAREQSALSGRNGSHPPLQFQIDRIGHRPAGCLPEDSKLMETLRAVDRHLGLRTEQRIASTDANIPLSLGVPAVTLGAGGSGGGIHTRAEWYDANGRELGLRRILMLLLAMAETAG
jgi:tripeptide aminopeptidase